MEITLEIQHIGTGGDGVGMHGQKPVYVPKTAAGDIVKLRLEKESAEGFTARLLDIETPSPVRVPAPCPHFARCGGCSLQHVNDAFYRNWKIEKVHAALARASVSVQHFENPVFLSAANRRRTTLAAFKNGRDIRMGYNEPRSNNILDIRICLVLEPELADAVQGLRAYLPRLLPERKPVDIMLQRTGGLDMVLTGPWRDKKGDFTLEQLEGFAEAAEALDIARITVRDNEFAVPEMVFTRKDILKNFGAITPALPPGAFLQASLAGEEALVQIVTGHAAGAQNTADLFAGCGTFTGTLLQSGANVLAVDGDAAAINAVARTKHARLETERRNLFKSPLTTAELKRFDAVVFDPPRAGAKEQATILAHSAIPKIIGVSCNPASFARDAKTLQDGGYSLKSLTIIDQFTWSAHVETVALFTR